MKPFEKEYIKKVFGDSCRFDEPLKNHCSFKIGGKADCFCFVDNTKKLILLLKYVIEQKIPTFVLGNGTNVLFCDEGYRGVVIKLNGEFLSFKQKNDKIIVGAGFSLPALCVKASNCQLSGMEWAVGIPGTVGGAICSNAGAFGSEISCVVEKVKILLSGKIITLGKDKCQFSYRNSIFSHKNAIIYENSAIILQIILKLKKEKGEIIESKQKECLQKRKQSQPKDVNSAGSVFLRNGDFIPAKAIDELGLKGFTIGGAQVSKVHAGFIVNLGEATCQDVLDLILYIKEKVFNTFSEELKTEIVIMGEKNELVW